MKATCATNQPLALGPTSMNRQAGSAAAVSSSACSMDTRSRKLCFPASEHKRLQHGSHHQEVQKLLREQILPKMCFTGRRKQQCYEVALS